MKTCLAIKAGGCSHQSFRWNRGFALVITLSLMVLLTVIAVGLLTLSSKSLATSGRESELAEARANARLALSMAIAQLQKQTGPDQRITVEADQLAGGGESEDSGADPTRRHWAGVYRSWPESSQSRPDPEFLSWLVSGESRDLETVDTAKSGGGDEVVLVGPGTVGNAKDGEVRVPALRVGGNGRDGARLAWWTGDQGVKAALATPPVPEDSSFAALRANVQAAPRNAVEFASAGSSKPFGKLENDDERIARVTGWQQAGFLADNPEEARPLFHDLAPFSTGLLTNVRSGGFRKDLSMRLELQPAQANSLLAPARTALYKSGNQNGINLHELWAYYNLYKELRRSGSARYTTGGTLPSGNPFLTVDPSPSACQNDDEFFFKQPVIVSYQTVLSFEARAASSGNGMLDLRVVSDPVITFWNPLDVPVVVPVSAYITTKYWQIPYDLYISVNGGPMRQCPLVRSFSPCDSNYMSLVAGKNQQLVFKPGEVIKVSQSGNLIVRSGPGTEHNLAALAGFNFGGGVSYPVRDLNGNAVQIAGNASIRYEARPNGYTSGQTSSSGLVPPGYNQHTRHFSLTHHEVYVGDDRGSNSLGYGGMYIDWDFGNRRLGVSETRAENQPGTKPPGQRLYATRFPEVFRPLGLSDGRQLSAAELNGRKAPFMILSYNAKTEEGTNSNARTRYLGRFNPKVHHVDFYDLTQAERDLLPYEYVVEPLVSWKNRSLETSSNGNAYFGGGMNAELGTSFVTTHSIPREPIVSLAALQHSFANGFEMQKPRYGYAALNGREPMQPQISHAIGNSVAPPMLQSGQTVGTLSGGRPTADHSYLANLGLWDDWFFSGVAPQTVNSYSNRRAQRQVAQEFLEGAGKLPVVRYLPVPTEKPASEVLSKFFSGATPRDAGINEMASLIRVDGLFNVNSTSVEAWKAMLGTLKGRQVVVRDQSGAESIGKDDDNAPVANLNAPVDQVVDADGNLDVKAPEQWVGRRTLSEDEIESLALGIVKEVRKRGPFLSLADFVNRRVGSDVDLARAGAIQCALDSEEVGINSAFQGSRAVANSVSSRFTFPKAEEGPAGYGMPGIVKQGDILTPIAPVLSARSDSFIIRAYGESVAPDGKVLARAWCEATVERDRRFIDPADEPETPLASLDSEMNERFGRRYQITTFRWLHPEEI